MMITALNDVVTVDPDGLVRCCAWCVSPLRLAELHRLHLCSDCLCVPCRARLERAL